MLISIILYCDYTELSADFTSTFRKISTFEPIDSVKIRHSKYCNWSKNLKDCISVFGQSYNKSRGRFDFLVGPFYTGMNYELKMPQFNISLHGPVSTSKSIECTTKFSGQSGIIITFDNRNGYARGQKGFDVSTISRYGGAEEER